jgi:endonuclease/exonuclease/phosphatase family metal-dependent hydrolase
MAERACQRAREFNRNLIALGDFNIDRRDDPYWLAFASTGLGAPSPLQEARRNISAASGGTDKYYDQIAWFQDGDLAKLTLEYKSAGSFLWTDYILQGMTNPSKKARISDHYPLWVEFRDN